LHRLNYFFVERERITSLRHIVLEGKRLLYVRFRLPGALLDCLEAKDGSKDVDQGIKFVDFDVLGLGWDVSQESAYRQGETIFIYARFRYILSALCLALV